jgi:chaperonin GroES
MSSVHDQLDEVNEEVPPTQPGTVDHVALALAMDVPWQPLYDQVLVKPLKPEEIRNGIIIPDNAKERSQAGVVLATGPGIQTPQGFIEVEVWKGDLILFGKYAGFEVGVEKLSELAGGEIHSDVENLMTLRAQEVRLVRRPRPARPSSL